MRAAIVLIGILVALVAVIALQEPAPPSRLEGLSKTRLRQVVDALLYRGFDGGMLLVEANVDGQFVQIRKEITSNGVRLRSDFPLSAWSEQYYPKVKAQLQSHNYSFHEIAGASEVPAAGAASKVLVIDFGPDAAKATEYIEWVFSDIYEVSLSTAAFAELRNISPLNGRIGFDGSP